MRAYVRSHLSVVRKPPKSRPTRRRSRAPAGDRDLTIAATIALYLRQLPTMVSVRGQPYSADSVRTYTEHLSAFARWCGPRHLDALDGQLLSQHHADLRSRGRAPSTIAGRENVIRVWLAWCVERKILTKSPLDRVRRTRAKDPPIEAFHLSEIRRLLGACNMNRWDGYRNTAIIWTFLTTGIRASELTALDLDDYEPDAGEEPRLKIRHGKGDKFRLVGVPDDAAAAIDDWLLLGRGKEPGPLFPSERDDGQGRLKPIRRESLTQLLSKLGAKVSVHAHPHKFRHTFALDYLRNGGDIYTLSRLLGHSNIQMSARYLRALQDEEAAATHVQTMRRRGRR